MKRVWNVIYEHQHLEWRQSWRVWFCYLRRKAYRGNRTQRDRSHRCESMCCIFDYHILHSGLLFNNHDNVEYLGSLLQQPDQHPWTGYTSLNRCTRRRGYRGSCNSSVDWLCSLFLKSFLRCDKYIAHAYLKIITGIRNLVVFLLSKIKSYMSDRTTYWK